MFFWSGLKLLTGVSCRPKIFSDTWFHKSGFSYGKQLVAKLLTLTVCSFNWELCKLCNCVHWGMFNWGLCALKNVHHSVSLHSSLQMPSQHLLASLAQQLTQNKHKTQTLNMDSWDMFVLNILNHTNPYLIFFSYATHGVGVLFSSRCTFFHWERERDCFEQSLCKEKI